MPECIPEKRGCSKAASEERSQGCKRCPLKACLEEKGFVMVQQFPPDLKSRAILDNHAGFALHTVYARECRQEKKNVRVFFHCR